MGSLYSNTEHTVESWKSGVSQLAEGADELRTTIDVHLAEHHSVPPSPEGEILTEIHGEYRTLLSNAKSALDGIVEGAGLIVDAPKTNGDSPWRQWDEKLAAFRGEYQLAVSRSTAHREKLEQLTQIEEQLRAHQQETLRLEKEQKAVDTAEEDYNSARDSWKRLISARDDLLDAQCSELTANSGGAIRAHVSPFTPILKPL